MPALLLRPEQAKSIARKRLKLMIANKYDCETRILWHEFEKQLQEHMPDIIEKTLSGQKTCVVKLNITNEIKKEVESFYQREISKAWKHVFRSYGYGINDIPT